MRLHLQKTVRTWTTVEIAGSTLNRTQPLIEKIEQVLKQERDHRSDERNLSGFYVTLSSQEESKLRKLLEPIFGSMNDEEFKRYISNFFYGSESGIKVYHFRGGEGLKKGTVKPSFTFGLG